MDASPLAESNAAELAARELLKRDPPTPEEREVIEEWLTVALASLHDAEPLSTEEFVQGWLDACALWILENRVTREAETFLAPL